MIDMSAPMSTAHSTPACLTSRNDINPHRSSCPPCNLARASSGMDVHVKSTRARDEACSSEDAALRATCAAFAGVMLGSMPDAFTRRHAHVRAHSDHTDARVSIPPRRLSHGRQTIRNRHRARAAVPRARPSDLEQAREARAGSGEAGHRDREHARCDAERLGDARLDCAHTPTSLMGRASGAGRRAGPNPNSCLGPRSLSSPSRTHTTSTSRKTNRYF